MKLLILKTKCVVERAELDLMSNYIREAIPTGVLLLDDSIDYEVVEFDTCSLTKVDPYEAELILRNARLNKEQKDILKTEG